MSLDQQIEAFFSPLAEKLSAVVFYNWHLIGHDIPVIVLWLAIAALLFTVYFGFINLRGFTRALAIVRGKTQHSDASGEISHFQALSTAISGTVGVGNIGGVAVAITVVARTHAFVAWAGISVTWAWFILWAVVTKASIKFFEGHITATI